MNKVQILHYLQSSTRPSQKPATLRLYGFCTIDKSNNKLNIVSKYLSGMDLLPYNFTVLRSHKSLLLLMLIYYYFLSCKLDAYTSKAWQLDRDINASLSQEEYLERRAPSSENAEIPQPATRVTTLITTSGDQPPLSYCKYNHLLYILTITTNYTHFKCY